jgi:hypothetical protein
MKDGLFVLFAKTLSILICVAILFSSCVNKNSVPVDAVKEKSDSVSVKKNKTYSQNDRIKIRDSLLSFYMNKKNFSYKESIRDGIYSLEVETFCLNDTLANEDSYDSLTTRPIIINQKLIFKCRDSVTTSFYIPIRSVNRKNYLGKNVKTLDANIWNIFVLKGEKGHVFAIDGTGFCNGRNCPEFSGLYSIEGTPLYQSYSDKWDKKKVDEIYIKFGITNNIYRTCSQNGTRIDKFWYGM